MSEASVKNSNVWRHLAHLLEVRFRFRLLSRGDWANKEGDLYSQHQPTDCGGYLPWEGKSCSQRKS